MNAAAAHDPDAAAVAALDDAVAAALACAMAPAVVGGVHLRGPAGPLRDAWVALLTAASEATRPWRRLPLDADDPALLGGIDLTATLATGRPVMRPGLLSALAGGVLVVPGAERIARETAGRLSVAPEAGAEGAFALLVLDEGEADDEPPPGVLTERCGLAIDLARCAFRPARVEAGAARLPDVRRARTRWRGVLLTEAQRSTLAAASVMLGVGSIRALVAAAQVARLLAALDGESAVGEAQLQQAIRLTLLPRATRLPAPPNSDTSQVSEPPPPQDSEDTSSAQDSHNQQALEDRVIASAAAQLPPDLLAALAALAAPRRTRARGRSGGATRSRTRGRPAGSRRGSPAHGARLDILATLRAAVPWQRLREPPRAPLRVAVRCEDLRIRSFLQPTATTTIFAVDASGSAALHRLAEAKGAVELLLADCYVRRDCVGLIAFRGAQAQTLLPPTRALARAKRCLDALPGGGGTPIASGLETALVLGREEARRGRRVQIVILTDGRANIDRDGRPGRAKAEADALTAARHLAETGWPIVLIDASARPEPAAARLATAAKARYLPLPYADAAAMTRAIRAAT
jgi:magnesium chelatase subunit D